MSLLTRRLFIYKSIFGTRSLIFVSSTGESYEWTHPEIWGVDMTIKNAKCWEIAVAIENYLTAENLTLPDIENEIEIISEYDDPNNWHKITIKRRNITLAHAAEVAQVFPESERRWME